ncbi:MAG TPA: 2OG-Fe(II) oxygenase [Stellaceae bacterium]|nr:2OG-Fe(II) oxygenase [Stellaceae bacterium]
MSEDNKTAPAIPLGDPVPWFSLPTVAGGRVDMHVDAGRWVVLSFLRSLADPASATELATLLQHAGLFREEHLVFYAVLTEPPKPEIMATLANGTGPALNFLADYDGAITRAYGADVERRTIVLDPMLRAVANVPFSEPGGHAAAITGLFAGLPAPGESFGTAPVAPVLIVPRVFEFNVCDFLVDLYDKYGGEDSGFLLDRDGKTSTVLNPMLKRRKDMAIADPQLRALMRDRVVRRLLPEIERYFQFKATRMDRYLVSCYDATDGGGHFYRHRDNVNAGARHRRFALSLGLNNDYEGGELRFPEFGPQLYRPPVGGAIVFSCGMLHEVLPITAGRRFVFVPFLYGEDDAKIRMANNANLATGEAAYAADSDLLFPNAS